MSRPLVTCGAEHHPGTHFETGHCIAPTRETAGHRLRRWLERRFNPKQGRGRECTYCGNGLITVAGRCTYCETRQP